MIATPIVNTLVVQEDEFTATAGQTLFTLRYVPRSTESLRVEINGVGCDDVADYTINGKNITWLDTKFVLDAGDKIIVRYT
jgi:hypothetical protein